MRRGLLVLAVAVGCGRIHIDPIGDDGAASASDATTLNIPPLRISGPDASVECGQLVWTGADLAIVWRDSRTSNPDSRLYFTRVGIEGSILVDEQLLSPIGQYIGCPSLAWTGSAVAAAWHMDLSEDVHMGIIDLAGTMAPQTPVGTLGPNETSPQIAWNGSQLGMVYGYHNGANESLRFAPVSAGGSLLAPATDLRVGAGAGGIGALASGFAVINIVGQFNSEGAEYLEVDDAGTIVVPPQLVIPATNAIGRFVYVHDGTHYVIAHQDTSDHLVTSVGSRTTATVSATIGTGKTDFLAATAAPLGFAVAWIEDDGTAKNKGPLLFARVDTAGAPTSPVYRIAADAHSVAVTALPGDRFAVIYSEPGTLDLILLVFAV